MSHSLVIDIGGTYCRIAIMDQLHTIHYKERFLNFHHATFFDVYQKYAALYPRELELCNRCCIAVAGPVKNGKAKLTNIEWVLDVNQLQSKLPFEQVELINDFHALGFCIPLLTSESLLTLQLGKTSQHQTKAIVGAGTGLGVAHIRHKDKFIEVCPSEGGHVDFAPVNKRQIALLEFLLQKYQHVSVEHLLSGHGIENLYEFICHENDHNFSVADHKACDISGQKIIKLAMEQHQSLAIEAIKLFSEIYAAFIGNIALHTLPYGGIYISAGIAKHILPYLRDQNFMRAYHNKGRLSSVLHDIPIQYIMHNNANLLGAGYYLSVNERESLAQVDLAR